VGQGTGDLDQQCPHQFLRNRQGHRQHGGRIDWLQFAGNLRRPGHRDGHGKRPRCGASALCDGSAQHSVFGTFLGRSEGEKQGALRRQPDLESLAVHRAYLDDQERELIMSLVGTIIYYPEESARDPEPIAPTLTSISQLLYGQGAAAGTDVVQHVLKCNDYSNCDVVTLNTTYTHTPFTAKVEAIMRSIAEKITTRTAIPNNSTEVGFVNQTTEPVYKMLSIGTSIPGSGLADSLIAQYRDVIAADYAYVFLERNLRLGMAALDKNYTLQQSQREQANQVRQRAQAMLMQLSQEKNLLYQKVGSFRAVSNHLEQLERQLRSSMPQHVMDMLGQQAAYLSQ
jgi:conjugative transfer pilus assembly protein TraH